MTDQALEAGPWVELVVRAHPDHFEAVADVLRDVAPDGVSIEPAILPSSDADFAYELLDAPGIVRAATLGPLTEDARHDLERRLAALALASGPPALEARPLPSVDWAEEWRRFYHVLRAGQRMVVKPSWELFEPQPQDVVIELDPGAAFGTGQHETTRLCLAALERELTEGARVLDLGTGSGILAIAAALLGASQVLAVDVDPEVVPVAEANAARNGVDSTVHVGAGSVGAEWPFEEPAEASLDLVVANISAATLEALMPRIVGTLRPGGVLIGSGFIEEGERRVAAAVSAAGLEATRVEAEGDWRCLVASRPR